MSRYSGAWTTTQQMQALGNGTWPKVPTTPKPLPKRTEPKQKRTFYYTMGQDMHQMPRRYERDELSNHPKNLSMLQL